MDRLKRKKAALSTQANRFSRREVQHMGGSISEQSPGKKQNCQIRSLHIGGDSWALHLVIEFLTSMVLRPTLYLSNSHFNRSASLALRLFGVSISIHRSTSGALRSARECLISEIRALPRSHLGVWITSVDFVLQL